MKTLWNNFKIAFAMFSKIPMPQADWTKENMKYFLCFFPCVGLVSGLLTFGWYELANYMGYRISFMAAVVVLIPVFVTGGIHIDGFLDTSDALSSWREKEKRLEILKDSHVGAFAVISACVYFLIQYGCASQVVLDTKSVLILCLSYVLSRCFSGIGVVSFPKAKRDGTVAEFSMKADDRTVRRILIILAVVAAVLMSLVYPLKGTLAWITALAVLLYYHHMAIKYFGGTTGDLSGWFLCICETAVMVVLAVLSILFI